MKNDIKKPLKDLRVNKSNNLLDLGEREEDNRSDETFLQRAKRSLSMRNKTKEIRYNVSTQTYTETVY